MSLKYANVSPTSIEYDGVPLKILNYGTTTVWVKPYSLSITTDDNMDVSITRTSSLYPDATIGLLVDSSIIYEGDEILLSFSPKNGYRIKTATVNGTPTHSGATVTVTGPLNIVLQTEESYTWHTIWSGSKDITTNTFITTNNSLPIRYRLNVTTLNETWQETNVQEVTCVAGERVNVQGLYDGIFEQCGQIELTTTLESGTTTLQIALTFFDRTGVDSGDPYSMKLNKLEAYY